jgi:ABC-2 type transport system ATP-binding protein
VELIQTKEVAKRFGSNTVLADVTLSIEEGDFFGVIGKSGSGKSTLLNLLTGFIRPTNGKVLYKSSATHGMRVLHEHLHQLKKNIGYTPHHNSFYPKLTVKENLLHFGILYGIKQDTLVHNAQGLLQFTKLWGHHHKFAGELSEGMQRRLEICCSLIHKPKILVLDEPTVDLDPLIEQEILHLLQDINKQGVTIIIASHHLDSIDDVCNKVAIIRDGKVHTHGLLEEVKRPYVNEHFTINVHQKGDRQLLIQQLQAWQVGDIIEHGNKLVICPQNKEMAIRSILQLVENEQLQLHDLDVRSPRLHEVFEKIHQDE